MDALKNADAVRCVHYIIAGGQLGKAVNGLAVFVLFFRFRLAARAHAPVRDERKFRVRVFKACGKRTRHNGYRARCDGGKALKIARRQSGGL